MMYPPVTSWFVALQVTLNRNEKQSATVKHFLPGHDPMIRIFLFQDPNKEVKPLFYLI